MSADPIQPAADASGAFALGDCTLDTVQRRLRRAGSDVRVEPKVLDLLIFLVTHRGEAVAKETILQALWPDVAVTHDSLKRLVKEARRALGETARSSTIIETLRGWGYRLHAEPIAVEGEAAAAQPYVGRAGLLERAGGILRAAVSGESRIVLLVGDAGIGKTRTAMELAERARVGDVRVARSRIDATTGASAYRPWTQVVRSLARAADDAQLTQWLAGNAIEVVRILPELEERLGVKAPPLSRNPETARFRFFDAMAHFVGRIAESHPLVLVLDDLHVSDSGSLHLFDFVASELTQAPIALIGTYREPELLRQPAHARALDRISSAPNADRFDLLGLDADEIRDLLRVRLGDDPPRELVLAMQRTTRGNPLLMGEILAFIESRGGPGRLAPDWHDLIPRGAEQVIGRRLARISREAHRALCAASVLGEDFGRAAVEDLVGESAREAIQEAVEASILVEDPGRLDRLRFSHALIRETLYEGLEPESRFALHRKAAERLEGSLQGSHDERLAELAFHLCRAAPSGDAGHAADVAVAAADQLSDRNAHEAAEALYRVALEVMQLDPTADDVRRARVLCSLARAELATVGLEQARLTYRNIVSLGRKLEDPELVASGALGYAGRPESVGASDPMIVDLLEEALEWVDEDSPQRIRLLSRLGSELRYEEPLSQARALVREAIDLARRRSDLPGLAQALDHAAWFVLTPEERGKRLERNTEIVRVAREAGDAELELSGRSGCLTAFIELGDLGSFDEELERFRVLADRLRSPQARWLLTTCRATRELLEGRFDDAERSIARAVAESRRARTADVEIQSVIQLYYLQLERGNLDGMEGPVQSMVARFPAATAWRAGLAQLYFASGRSDPARRILSEIAARGFERIPRDAGWMITVVQLAELCEGLDEAEHARGLQDEIEPFAGLNVVVGDSMLFYGSVQHHLGLLAAAQRDWERADSHLRAGLARHEALGARAWLAHSEAARARMLRRRAASGDRILAEQCHRRGLELARSLGMGRLQRRMLADA